MSESLAKSIIRLGGLILIVQGLVGLGGFFFVIIQSRNLGRSSGFGLENVAFSAVPLLVPFFVGFAVLFASGFLANFVATKKA